MEHAGDRAWRRAAAGLALLLLAASCSDGSQPDEGSQTSASAPPPTGSTSIPLLPETSVPLVREGIRYLDPVFTHIETIENVVYWPDAPPLPAIASAGRADLWMDIHLPVGDTEMQRPVIIALEASPDAWEVEHFVQRGYVVVVPFVRGRPNAPGLNALLSTQQGMVDAAGAVRYLRANATTYGLNPDAIAATGFSGGGIVSLALAWGQTNSPDVTEIDLFGAMTVPLSGPPDFGDYLADESSRIAAAFARAAWYPPELIDPGEPPVMLFNGQNDPTYPFEAVEQICPAAQEAGVVCQFRTFPTGHSLGHVGTMSAEAAVFLYEHMLAPLEVVDPVPTTVEMPDPAAIGTPTPIRTISPESGPVIVPAPQIEQIAVAPDGRVYAASREAIAMTDDRDTWPLIDFEGLPEGLPSEGTTPVRRVERIAVGPDGVLWVVGGSEDASQQCGFGCPFIYWVAARRCDSGLCAWEVTTDEELPELDSWLSGVAVGADGSVYVTTGQNALLVYSDSGWETHYNTLFPTDPDVRMTWARAISVGADGLVWIASNETNDRRALFAFDGADFTRHATADGSAGGRVYQLAAAEDGTIWAALVPPPEERSSPAAARAITSFDGSTWKEYPFDDGFLSSSLSVATGPDGTTWAAYTGLYARFDGTSWTSYPTGFTRKLLAVDTDGSLLMGAGADLVHFDGVAETVYRAPLQR